MTRQQIHAILCFNALLFMLAFSVFGHEQFQLASGGKTSFTIVIPDDAIPAEVTAGEELHNHLLEMTGADFPVVSARDFAGGPSLTVGFREGLPERLGAASYPDLGEEEFVIDAAEDTILLSGGRPRGALYASYEFLERLGVRWFTPEETLIPRRRELSIEVEPERYTSPFRSRTNVIGNNPTPEWSARNRMNSYIEWKNPGEKYGYGVLQGPDMDNMWRYFKPTVFREHPEWAALVDGKRQIEHANNFWGTCLSNAEFRKFAVNCALEWLRAHPDYTDVWLTSNDCSPYCECPECQALAKAHGDAPSAAQVILVNELADEVAQEFPGKRVKTLAYSWSQKPPTGLKLRDNVTVMVCCYFPGSRFGCFYELGVDDETQGFIELFEGWKKVCSDFETYLYSHPYDDFWFPAPCLYNQARNIRHIKDMGFKLLHQEDFGKFSLIGGEQCALRSWLFTRMAWRPDSDVEELIQDFCRNYYGPNAEDALYAIHRTEEKRANGWRPDDKCPAPFVPDYVDPEAVKDILARLRPAYDKQADPLYKKRLGYLMIPYLWADYWLGINSFGGIISEEEQTFGADVIDRGRREQEGLLIRQLMIENGVNAIQEEEKFNPQTLSLPELARLYHYEILGNGTLRAIVVPGLMGKLTELSLDGRNVFKAVRGHLKSQYPEYGYGRDFFNGQMPSAFTVTEQTGNRLVMETAIDGGTAVKSYALDGNELSFAMTVKSTSGKEWTFNHQPLFDLAPSPSAHLENPDLYVEFADGWQLTEIGRAGTHERQSDKIDIDGFTGRMILVWKESLFAIEMTFCPEELASLKYVYDGYGRILEHIFQSVPCNAAAGQEVSFHINYRLLNQKDIPSFK